MTTTKLNEYSMMIDSQAVKYGENELYITGKNPILKEPNKNKPDNKIPVPIAKSTVEDLAGYAAKPGNISITYDNITTEKDESREKQKNDYANINKEIYEINDGNVETSKLYSECIGQGVAYELFWVSDKDIQGAALTPEFAKVPGYQVMIEDDGALKPTITKAVRKYKKGDITYIDIYEPFFKTTYKKTGSDDWTTTGEVMQYPFSVVPIAIYKANDREQSIFDAEKPMIDAYDMIISRSTNDIERFNSAIAVFKEKVKEEDADKFRKGMIDLLDKMGGIDGASNGNLPKYLEKNLSGAFTFYDGFATRILKDIRSTIKVPDWASLQAGSDLSGKAMAYKLMALEFRVSEIEIGFNQGLKMRQNLIDQAITASPTSNIKTDDYKMVIKWERNLPVERDVLIDIAMNLKAMGISREIWLRLIPQDIINDVEAEIQRQDGEPTLDDISLTDGE